MKKRSIWSRLLRYVLIPLGILLASLVIVTTGYILIQQQLTARAVAITHPDGIQRLEQVTLGGYPQWISMRGEDPTAPVLLFLHGGPGASEMVPMRHHNQDLEKHFIVVNWDQRGTGKSYSPDIPPETMELEQFIQDTLELTRLLRDEFEQDRIYLVGHSWGTIIGTPVAQRHPEYYHAYVGIGQAVNFVEAEKISYQFTLDEAQRRQLDAAVEELEAIGPPPYSREEYHEKLAVQRKWLFRFGGEFYHETSNTRWLLDLARLHLIAPEYTLGDVINFMRGNAFSGEMLWDTLLATDLPSQVPALELPVYFFSGRHDYVTVFEKVEEYYNMLEAPSKELVWFEESAHSPNFEEPGRFQEELLRVKEATYPR